MKRPPRPSSPAGVAGVHRDEGHDGVLEHDLDLVKDEPVLARADRVEHGLVLGAAGGEGRARGEGRWRYWLSGPPSGDKVQLHTISHSEMKFREVP